MSLSLPHRRRQILQDMDVPVWVLRERLMPAAVTTAGAGRDAPAGAAPAASQVRLERLQADLGATPRAAQPAAGKPAAVANRSKGPAPQALGNLPPSLHCCWHATVAYLGPAYTEPSVRRFLRDLLVAAAGAPGKPAQLAFDAADLAAQLGVEQARRGLQAFVSKRLGTVDARLLLLDERLVDEVPGVEADGYRVSAAVKVPLLCVADLRSLQDDGAAKAQLWQRLLAQRPL